MARINCLTKEIAQKIAAGEVVERPASVVKELLENAIDAGATEITVEIQHGGIRYIRLTDNGCGILKEDVRTAFLSHATSKICKASDLDEIMTLGFRGEALPSIAAVSKLELMTKPKEEFIGTRILLEGGHETSFEEVGCPDGTTIIVRDLFFNTPARMKFLKSDRAEGMAVSALVDHLALSHPEISFCFIKDGKMQTKTSGNGDLASAIYSLYGKEFTDTLLPAQFQTEGIRVHGFVSSPIAARGSNSMQHFFVNHRYFKTRTGAAALMEAYKNSLMVGRFSAAVLFIDVDPKWIDVNVHPAKTEVRFSNERALFNAIYTAAKQAIEKDRTKKEVLLTAPQKANPTLLGKRLPTGEQITLPMTANETKPTAAPAASTAPFKNYMEKPSKSALEAYETELQTVKDTKSEYSAQSEPDLSVPTVEPENPTASAAEEANAIREESFEALLLNRPAEPVPEVNPQAKQTVQETFGTPISKADMLESAHEPIEAPEKITPKGHQIRVLGEAYQTYIIVICDGTLYIIDKHAAHERMLFNKLKKDNSENGAQMLLSPVPITLSKEEYAVLVEHAYVLKEAGFILEEFGEGTLLLRACPLNLEKQDLTALLTEIAGQLLKHHRDTLPEQLDWVYHSMSCRGAIKAGSDLTQYEMEHFVKELFDHDEIRFCPHGRPVMVELSQNELDKQFGRLG